MTKLTSLDRPIDVSTPRARLEYLAVMLDGVEALKRPFDIRAWWRSDRAHDCGTPACAMGWACRDPLFQAEGLATSLSGHSPGFEGQTDFRAASAFFGITLDQSEWLFHLSNYPRYSTPTAADVAARVRKLLARAPVEG